MKKVVLALLFLTLSASPSRAAGLQLTINEGRVSIDAQDVTIAQILTEWAKVGKTRIINLERVASGPITLKLDNVPEDRALDILLRAVPGYVAAPRPNYVANASVYDRIYIVATAATSAPRPTAPVAQAPAGYPPYPPGLSNITQLRPPPAALTPGVQPDPPDPGDFQNLPLNDPAIAAAAAAGLIAAPAPQPGGITGGVRPPLMDPSAPAGSKPATPAAAPNNPWNVSPGADRPGLAPTPPPTAPAPPATGIRRPPQADR
jgi:hypothetical protein